LIAVAEGVLDGACTWLSTIVESGIGVEADVSGTSDDDGVDGMEWGTSGISSSSEEDATASASGVASSK
jgi:hypothetical protein